MEQPQEPTAAIKGQLGQQCATGRREVWWVGSCCRPGGAAAGHLEKKRPWHARQQPPPRPEGCWWRCCRLSVSRHWNAMSVLATQALQTIALCLHLQHSAREKSLGCGPAPGSGEGGLRQDLVPRQPARGALRRRGQRARPPVRGVLCPTLAFSCLCLLGGLHLGIAMCLPFRLEAAAASCIPVSVAKQTPMEVVFAAGAQPRCRTDDLEGKASRCNSSSF